MKLAEHNLETLEVMLLATERVAGKDSDSAAIIRRVLNKKQASQAKQCRRTPKAKGWRRNR